MSLEQNLAGVEAKAVSKELAREAARNEARARRQEGWNNLLSGAKEKWNAIKKADQDGGRALRHIVDVAIGTKDAYVQTAGEEAIKAVWAVEDKAGEIVQAGVDTAQAIGRGAVRTGEKGHKLLVKIGEKSYDTAEAILDAVDAKVDAGWRLAEKGVDFVSKRAGEVRDRATEARDRAVEAHNRRVDRIKGTYNKLTTDASVAYARTSHEISGGIARSLVRHKENVARVQRENQDNFHDAMAGLHSLEHKVAAGVAGFFGSLAEKTAVVAESKKQATEKHLALKSTHVQVEAALYE